MFVKNSSISAKFWSLVAVFLAGLIIVSAISLMTMKKTLLDDRRAKVRQVVEAAHGMVAHYGALAKAGKLDEAAAKTQAKETLRSMRYDGKEYYWINDMQAIVVMHPIKPALEGKDLSGLKDAEGTALFSEFVNTVKKSGAGFVGYLWPKPGFEDPVRKVSYVKGFSDWNWVIGSGVYLDDVDAAFRDELMTLGGWTLALIIIAGGFAFVIAGGVAKPLASLSEVMAELAAGNLDVEVSSEGRRDEIGKMIEAVAIFKDQAKENRQLEEENAHAKETADREKSESSKRLAKDFETKVGGIIEALSSSATEMEQVTEGMSGSVDAAMDQSRAVVDAASTAANNVQSVASATEQLTGSINEISQQVTHSTGVAGRAVTEVEETNQRVSGLAEAANKIGEVVSMITDIAEQTNLLALNATIEAARAGDAGKGFAVVASEVKNLANQTAKATEEIAAQVQGIQTATKDSVSAIAGIGSTISEVSEITSAIAAAVEEQGAATQEISRNVREASTGTETVSGTIESVQTATNQTGEAAGSVLTSARDVVGKCGDLNREVDNFLKEVANG